MTDSMISAVAAKEDMKVSDGGGVFLSYDEIAELVRFPNKENANVPHGPEATNMTLASLLKKDYALRRVFTKDVADAHKSGDIKLNNLGMIDRVYCSAHSPAYVAKFGLSLPGQNTAAKPAKHATVFLEQLVKFAAGMQSQFAGAIGFDAINTFVAPYLVGKGDAELKQLAQILIYEFSQQAVSRGGQTVFSDLNIYRDVPKHYHDVEAVGPGGKMLGHTYGEYKTEANSFMKALMSVYLEGDGSGRPFFFPKPDCHIDAESVQDEEYMGLLGQVAAKMGSPYFLFDRKEDGAVLALCCRLKTKLTNCDMDDTKQPWKLRYTAMQNVTLNLPRIAYDAKGDDTKLFELLRERMLLAAKAHISKKEYIMGLLDMGVDSPLSMLLMDTDGEPYFRPHRSSFLIGLLGMNEMVQYHMGREMHESKEAIKFGLKVCSFMKQQCDDIGAECGIHMKMEQTPAESTAHSLALQDRKKYGERAIVRGSGDELYYTNSTQLATHAPTGIVERVKLEALFHPLIEAGCMTHVWLGEHEPSAGAIASFVRKTFENTQSAQITFSPEFTNCVPCKKTFRGLMEECPACHSKNVECMTRITGYFSKTNSWNKGKRGELKERRRVDV